MRHLYSYLLLFSLLFPSIAESFHAFNDSHQFINLESIDVHKSKFHCQIDLFLNQEDETDYFFIDVYESFIPFINIVSFIESDTPIIFYNYHSTRKRGPPAKV